MSRFGVYTFAFVCLVWFPARGRPEEAKKSVAPQTVEQIAAAARKSVVVVTFAGRDGKRQGLGTGFVVGSEGLIATNLHVLGEARPISVQQSDGKRYEVTAIHATDRANDLAIIRIAAQQLPALELGDSDALREGQPVVALGNPLGLTHSVVSGVVSAKREIEGRPMIQLAIPIEPGNSGGPLLDMHGRVQGILTLKSAVTANLGFAMPIKALRPLLQKPNPIPIASWLSIGTLDTAEWTPVFEGRWRQRGGKIIADGLGSGFGGRTLCLWRKPPPALPFEVAVRVRLDDEAGAAGLVFHADGGDKHYGFYPSAGQLRLTRFDGPDVYSWTILQQVPSVHYRPGEWNTLKVRVAADRLRCYVNDHLVIESTDTGLKSGQVGLAKFRQARAEFQHFEVGSSLAPAVASSALEEAVSQALAKLPPEGPPAAALVEKLAGAPLAGVGLLREKARQLDQQAAQLRRLAVAVHERRVHAQLTQILSGKEEAIDLAHAALLLANLDNEDLDVPAYRKQISRMADEMKALVPKQADDQARRATLDKYLFEKCGFHGSRSDYYSRANSYLSDVLDDREGLPITLSVLYLELGRRLGLRVEGIGLPGHFVVRLQPAKGEPVLIDVFERGQTLSKEEAERRVQQAAERPARPSDFAPMTKKAILVRILHNLIGVARTEGDAPGMLRYLDTILMITPDAGNDRLMRASGRFQTGDRAGALQDLDWLLEHPTPEIDEHRIRELRKMLAEQK